MTHFVNRAVTAGRPWPLGVTPDSGGVNVAVWAPEATLLEFCLFDANDVEERIALPARDGGIWHAHITGVGIGARYGLRADGPYLPAEGLRFNPNKHLIDPYARALDGTLHWDPLLSGYDAADGSDLTFDARDSAPVVPKCVVTDAHPGRSTAPDPASNRPHHALPDLVMYEAHVKGISAAHPGVPEHLRGTYAGMAHPAIIDHLVALGVNAVELMPVQAFFDDQFVVERGLKNYWGYQPIAWFAPEPRYAHRDAEAELRHLIYTLHEAGIEVIIDVVFNHTGEGDELGPTLSYRGLHNRGYYRLLDQGRHYVNDTGTGNTLAVDQPMVLRLVLDGLRHWAQHYGVDGFRFDLAATLGRTAHGFDSAGAFFQSVQQDPVLSTVRLIAEPWDLGPGGFQLGHFPLPWAEWNSHFRDGVRRAWKGDPLGQVNLGSILLGSAVLFDHSGRDTTASVNFITAHDGFTLADLVSYSEKRNEANLEENRDGHDANHSDNLGFEGPSDDHTVVSARARRVRGMLATLLLSQGVPMLLAGDEIGNSQGGNNNAYPQDNELGWVDWTSPDTELLDLVRSLTEVRRRLPVLRQRRFLHGALRQDGHQDVVWRLANGSEPGPEDWNDPQCRLMAAELRGAAGDVHGEALTDAVFMIVNVGGASEVRLPPADAGLSWHLEIDSARPWATSTETGAATNTASGSYPTLAQSVVLFSTVPGVSSDQIQDTSHRTHAARTTRTIRKVTP
ncbi:glycogen debranching protein GlgX [Leucobacter sp. Z1108]|uniref:glycogen debranching protein GlgX n=1 Tax=Leucobacter sp. Z1108 TaxID=3439066 RepID=UPI003F40A0ED